MSSELDRLIKDNSLSNGLPRLEKKKTALLTGMTGQVSRSSFSFYVCLTVLFSVPRKFLKNSQLAIAEAGQLE